MAYEMNWHVDKRIVIIRIFGELTAEELVAINRETADYVAEGTPMLHLILDLHDINHFPKLSEAMKVDFKTYDDVGWTIIVGANKILKFFSSVIVQVTGARYRMTTTIEESIAFLQQNDATLPENIPTSINIG